MCEKSINTFLRCFSAVPFYSNHKEIYCEGKLDQNWSATVAAMTEKSQQTKYTI